MKASGAIQLSIWHVRLQIRRFHLLREIVRMIRSLRPDSRERHLRTEVIYWRRWLLTEGLEWPEEFATRFDAASPLEGPVARVVSLIPRQKVHVLDVGAGPATALGKVHPAKDVVITATDPLAREYGELMAEFGREPPVPTIYAEAEKLQEQLGDSTFDIVHARNSLDHSADPVAGLEQMLALTTPGGFIVLLHEENEGLNEMYYALHKWDFSCDNGHFIIKGPGPKGRRRDMTKAMRGRAEVDCSVANGEILVVMRKLPAAASEVG